MTSDHGLVTPEAVRLDLPEATVGSRGIAVIVDWILQAILGALLAFGAQFAFDAPGMPTWVPVSTALVLTFLIYFGYPIGFETVRRGRTPGKALMGLRVVTVEGGPVRFRHAAIRAALGLIDFGLTFGLAAVLSSLLSKRSQRLGDFVAGTVVLRERSGTGTVTSRRFEIPPGAEALAGSLDPSGLTSRDYAAVREFLVRAGTLSDDRRDALARQLLEAITPRLGVAPDSWQEPEVVLQVVAARYQQRSTP